MKDLANIKEILDGAEEKCLLSTKYGDFVLLSLEEYLHLKDSQKTGENLTEGGLVDRINRDLAQVSLENLEEQTQVQWPQEEDPLYLEPIDELLKH